MLPHEITAGTAVEWIDTASPAGFDRFIGSPTWTLTYYLRTNTDGQGVAIQGNQYLNTANWKFTLSGNQTQSFIAGDWDWSAIATSGDPLEIFQLARGDLKVRPSLIFTGTPTAIDNRTQNEKDLDAVKAAIRAIVADKAAEYSIGNRRFKRVDLAELRALEAELKSRVFTEKRYDLKSQGLGDPKCLYVRF